MCGNLRLTEGNPFIYSTGGIIISKSNKKELFLENLANSHGIICSACDKTGVSRVTYYHWLKKDDAFRERVMQINERTIDIVEGYLLELIKDKNPSAVFFYLKTKGKHRGYGERMDIGLTGTGEPFKITFENLRDILKTEDKHGVASVVDPVTVKEKVMEREKEVVVMPGDVSCMDVLPPLEKTVPVVSEKVGEHPLCKYCKTRHSPSDLCMARLKGFKGTSYD